jgi:hypothetical protein
MSLEHSPERGAPAFKHRRLFDPEETSAYLRIAKQTLAKWRSAGGGPRFVRIGGRIFYDVADLDAFIAARKFQSTAEADQAA